MNIEVAQKTTRLSDYKRARKYEDTTYFGPTITGPLWKKSLGYTRAWPQMAVSLWTGPAARLDSSLPSQKTCGSPRVLAYYVLHHGTAPPPTTVCGVAFLPSRKKRCTKTVFQDCGMRCIQPDKQPNQPRSPPVWNRRAKEIPREENGTQE